MSVITLYADKWYDYRTNMIHPNGGPSAGAVLEGCGALEILVRRWWRRLDPHKRGGSFQKKTQRSLSPLSLRNIFLFEIYDSNLLFWFCWSYNCMIFILKGFLDILPKPLGVPKLISTNIFPTRSSARPSNAPRKMWGGSFLLGLRVGCSLVAHFSHKYIGISVNK